MCLALTRKSHTLFFFFNDTATTEIYTLSLHDALPIYRAAEAVAILPGVRAELRDHRHHVGESPQHLPLRAAGGPVFPPDQRAVSHVDLVPAVPQGFARRIPPRARGPHPRGRRLQRDPGHD